MLLLTRQLDCKTYVEKLCKEKHVRTRQLLTAKVAWLVLRFIAHCLFQNTSQSVPRNRIKKLLHTRCFPVKFAKFSKTDFFIPSKQTAQFLN